MNGYRILYSIAQFIENQGKLSGGCGFVIGEDLFVGNLPVHDPTHAEPPVRCVVVLQSAGGGNVPDLPDWEEKAIQIWNRADHYVQANDDAYCLYYLLHGTAGWTLPATLGGDEYCAMVINAVATPAAIENPDERGHFVFSTNYIFSVSEEFPPGAP